MLPLELFLSLSSSLNNVQLKVIYVKCVSWNVFNSKESISKSCKDDIGINSVEQKILQAIADSEQPRKLQRIQWV